MDCILDKIMVSQETFTFEEHYVGHTQEFVSQLWFQSRRIWDWRPR